MIEYWDILLFVNVYNGSKFCPSVLKTEEIPVSAQRINFFFQFYLFPGNIFPYICVSAANTVCNSPYILILIILFGVLVEVLFLKYIFYSFFILLILFL
jgi:hypothetical protein